MAGVGGQGVLLASETLALAALSEGLEAKQSEVHGVAQRGGSVVSHVRFGPRVFSPLIRCGEVDLLYAGERLEALRYAHYLKPSGVVVMNDQAVHPIRYPGEDGTAVPGGRGRVSCGAKAMRYTVVPALETAVELGDKRCANIVLLGVIATLLDLKPESWTDAIKKRFPAKIHDLNLRALAAGQEFAATA